MILNTYTVRVALAVALLALLPTFSKAQVTILSTSHIVQPDEAFTVDIKGVDFENILACQFSVSWDSTAFQFLGTENLNAAFLDYPLEHFGSPIMGQLGFSWLDFSLAGITLEDSTTLFSLKFKTIEEYSGDYTVGFGNFPTAVEVADTAETVLNVEFHEGTITIDGISGLFTRNASDWVQLRCAPNPFHQQTQVQLDFLRPSTVSISVSAPDGRPLFSRQGFFPAGPATLDLSKDIFSQAGVYLLKIQSKDFLITQKLIAL
ncbi:MAG: T9SS type A sorting domain-containing protein [Phaeodactylibacter sp.]|nr:T9SS type A sorting domain-containing protein [Phaeodactylibacter sp.]MCB9276649.1 T9SS type A sorting domain-containing protein [Lewinellaceae bacterium]